LHSSILIKQVILTPHTVARTHTNTHTRTHTLTRTHTHTHKLQYFLPFELYVHLRLPTSCFLSLPLISAFTLGISLYPPVNSLSFLSRLAPETCFILFPAKPCLYPAKTVLPSNHFSDRGADRYYISRTSLMSICRVTMMMAGVAETIVLPYR
jgi:hypothetical protein